MDDLFQSLGTPGQGAHSRSRPEAGASAVQGTAFGATFESAPIAEADWPEPERPGDLARAMDTSDVPAAKTGPDTAQNLQLVMPNTDDVTDTNAVSLEVEAQDAPPPGRSESPSILNIAITAQFATNVPGSEPDFSRSSVGDGPLTVRSGTPDIAAIDPVPALGISPEGIEGLDVAAVKQVTSTGMPVMQPTAGSSSVPQAALQNGVQVSSSSAGAMAASVDRVGTLTQSQTNPLAHSDNQSRTISSIEGKTLQASTGTIPSSDPASNQIRPDTISPSPRPVAATQITTLTPDARNGSQDLPDNIPLSDHNRAQPPVSTTIVALAQSGDRAAVDGAVPMQPSRTEPNLAKTARGTWQAGDATERALGSGTGTAEQNSAQGRPLPTSMSETTIPIGERKNDAPILPRPPVPQPSPPGSSSGAIPIAPPPMVGDFASSIDTRPALPRLDDATTARTGSWTIAPTTTASQIMSIPMPSILQSTPGLSPTPAILDVSAEPLADIDFTLQTLSATSTMALTPSVFTSAQAPSATAQVIAQQIAAVLSKGPPAADTPLELALDPPELGRLRMQITEVAGVMTLMIQAERPETADLMRRHLDLLAQEFAQEGLAAPSVHISQEEAEGGGQHTQGEHADPVSSLTSDAGPDAPLPQTNHAASGALDLRL